MFKSFIMTRSPFSNPAILITKEEVSLRANRVLPWVKFPSMTGVIKEPDKGLPKSPGHSLCQSPVSHHLAEEKWTLQESYK